MFVFSWSTDVWLGRRQKAIFLTCFPGFHAEGRQTNAFRMRPHFHGRGVEAHLQEMTRASCCETSASHHVSWPRPLLTSWRNHSDLQVRTSTRGRSSSSSKNISSTKRTTKCIKSRRLNTEKMTYYTDDKTRRLQPLKSFPSFPVIPTDVTELFFSQ